MSALHTAVGSARVLDVPRIPENPSGMQRKFVRGTRAIVRPDLEFRRRKSGMSRSAKATQQGIEFDAQQERPFDFGMDALCPAADQRSARAGCRIFETSRVLGYAPCQVESVGSGLTASRFRACLTPEAT